MKTTSPSPAKSNVDTGKIEKTLAQDRRLVLLAIIILTTLSWVYLHITSGQMASGDMSSMGMGDMADPNMMGAMTASQMPWTFTTFFLMFVMWSVMMIGMMIPSAAPTILLFAKVQRKKLADQMPATRIASFTAGYLLVWICFSVAATGLQWILTEARLLSPMMVSANTYLATALLISAGLYQLTPLKHACLKQCQTPLGFLTRHWRDGTSGALQMGIHHGMFCLGCCWVLMALLFVGGVMNLAWIAAIAIFVLVEKLVPKGEIIGRVSGIMMIGFGVYIGFLA
jgi:predicted metal-binding membrane protein